MSTILLLTTMCFLIALTNYFHVDKIKASIANKAVIVKYARYAVFILLGLCEALIIKDWKMCVCCLISYAVFLFLTYMIKTKDPESKMHIFTDVQLCLISLLVVLQNYIVTYRFDKLFDQVFFAIFLGIMLMHAHTDLHTKFVYRIFSYFIWVLGIIYTIINLFVFKEIASDQMGLFLAGTIVFIALMFIGSIFSGFIHGKGDGYILVGVALFIQFLSPIEPRMGVEPILWFYCFSALGLIFANLNKINFKKGKLKRRVAFAPFMYSGTLMTIAITSMPEFLTWVYNISK